MATKRMFSNQVINSEGFRNLSSSAVRLYFYLCMSADDDGLIPDGNAVRRLLYIKNSFLDELVEGGFVQKFPSGVFGISHWRIHNSIPPSRYQPTVHKNEKEEMHYLGDVVLPKIKEEFVPPTLDEVKAFAEKNELYSVDIERFFNHYTGHGWQVNGNTVSDWQALLKKWDSVDYEKERYRTRPPRYVGRDKPYGDIFDDPDELEV